MRHLAALTLSGLALAAAALLPVPDAQAQSLDKAWEVTGLARPESALWDGAAKVIYVSNINGNPGDKDGNGYISKLSADGKVMVEKWATGLDAPKGMALVGSQLFVSDIDRLVSFDTRTGKMLKVWQAPGAKFLNDVAADANGTVFVSDMMGNAIWRMHKSSLAKWLEGPELANPNGLKLDGQRLVVAAWGPMTGEGFASSAPGPLKAVSIADKIVRDIGPGIGNLDGLEPDGKGGWLVSDWMAGKLYHADRNGRPTLLATLKQGSADIGVIPAQKLVLVPMMLDGTLVAYRLP